MMALNIGKYTIYIYIFILWPAGRYLGPLVRLHAPEIHRIDTPKKTDGLEDSFLQGRSA